ncbi:MAG: hypothetical protein Kow0065_18860 [Methylomicrobium sp.]
MRRLRDFWFFLLPPLLALVTALTVQFKTDLSAFIVAGDSAEALLLASEMQSGALSRRYLISIGSESGPPTDGEFMQTLQARLKTIDGVADVWLPGRQNDWEPALLDLYSRYGSALFSLDPARDLTHLFGERGLERRAEWLKQALLSPQGAMVKKIALHDPLLLTLDGFRSVGEKLRQNKPIDTPYRNLVLETEVDGLDTATQRRIQNEINAVFVESMQNRNEAWRLEMTGVPVFAAATQQLIQGDVTLIGILSSIALMLLFLLLFRSFGALFLVFSLLMTVLLSAILATNALFGYVHGMTVAIGSTLIGICIDYPIHAIAHAHAARDNEKQRVVAEIWPSMLLGGATTLIGYAALGASGYPGFRQVAVYAGVGIIVALLLTRFALPKHLTSPREGRLNVPLTAIWVAFCHRFRPWLLVGIGILSVASLLGLPSLRWLDDMQDLTPELNALKENDKRIRARTVSIEPGRFVLVTAADTETALQKAERVYSLLDRLKRQGDLSDYFGLYPWLLSAERQQQNQMQLQRYLTDENRRLWQQALRGQGLSVERLGDWHYPIREALTSERVFATPVKRMIDNRIMTTANQTAIMIWLADHKPSALIEALNHFDGIRYFSQRDLLNDMMRDYTERARLLLAVGLSAIMLLLIVRYQHPTKALLTLSPALLAALLILGFWSASGAAISFLHLVGFLLVVSICVDYGIFYQENRGGDIGLTYRAMAASMLTSALAFGCLGVADSLTLKIMAGVVACGVLVGFLLCPLLIDRR